MNSEDARQAQIKCALDHLQSAIALLDELEAPGNIAAHASLSVSQLEDWMLDSAGPSLTQPCEGWRTALTS